MQDGTKKGIQKFLFSLLLTFSCWSIVVVIISIISIIIWYSSGYNIYWDKPYSDIYIFLRSTINWYVKPSTILYTLLFSFAVCIVSSILWAFKVNGKLHNIPGRFQKRLLILNIINFILWFCLACLQ